MMEVTDAHLGPIWYHSKPSDVPYSPNQFLGWDLFCRLLQKDSSIYLVPNTFDLWTFEKRFPAHYYQILGNFCPGGPNVLEPNVLGPIVFGTK